MSRNWPVHELIRSFEKVNEWDIATKYKGEIIATSLMSQVSYKWDEQCASNSFSVTLIIYDKLRTNHKLCQYRLRFSSHQTSLP